MKKKGIFGGTFDPIHNGHLHIAYEALYKLNLDKIIFIPSGNPPHKTNKSVTNAETRYKLVERVIKNEKKFEVSRYELEKKSFSYTYQTLQYFNEKEPDTEWYFITGADCLMELNSWKSIDEILKLCHFVVFRRNGYSMNDIIKQKKQIEHRFNKSIIFLDIPIIDISSTFIREKSREEKNVSYLVPEVVSKFLKESHLYK
ncbi:nicotinate-nucleotide adenylyltransferase [Clostridium botulinum]|uniref:Probable nicotinate-nucleotide adenylyltransferase n=1 Tax=Clostridium botulinum TaxID=1491 RepID=A0A9Q1UZF0_CLOBO|nr:nicotinate-nucleotide adenylyltransferase [Clostridium botulinum]KEH97449.1 nicotinate-nucleotide adenylyltransferase [Clostridium botulinum D str. 16868]KEI02014.1 nicotinate-nucleotide adenylyltransferase [Clostridium botulinum C/D str. Sp77]KLU76093.1 nicotinate-nucleotide adenylyltransferase [Clostridium botulinum V891]KOA74026.1 nicotinate-nucleotide adenylyltransferase [Clostridium botulinum]KOA75404.1 nicotinate-nucleotide adenylyltransferase [Clostridium botulinum]